MRLPLAIAATLILTGSAGCAPKADTVYVTMPLPLPARPTLPNLSADDLQCLSDGAYSRLAERDMLRRQYAEKMEDIIKATHK